MPTSREPRPNLKQHLAAPKRTVTGRRRPGRPSTGVSVKTLIVRLAPENPASAWGHSRSQGELARPGQAIAAAAVREILHAAGIDPAPRRTGPTGREFPAAQAPAIIARSFLAAKTMPLQQLDVPAFIEPGTRKPHRAAVTAHPTAAPAMHQARHPPWTRGTAPARDSP